MLHGLRAALTVHQHIAGLVLHKHVQQGGIKGAGRNIVDDGSPHVQHSGSRGGMVGVHGDYGSGRRLAQPCQNWQQALGFLLGGQFRSSGPRRFRAKVKNVCTLVAQGQRMVEA